MDDDEFDLVNSEFEAMNEPKIAEFVRKHAHDLTTCEYCDRLYEEESSSIIGSLLDMYENGSLTTAEPSDQVVKAMCNAVSKVWETVETWDSGLAAMPDLMRLTLFPTCSSEVYEKIVEGFDWTFFRDQEWSLDDVSDFLGDRASLPNATKKFIKGVINEYHMNPHGGGDITSCEECQSLLREFVK